MVDAGPAEAWLRGVHGERSLSKDLQKLLLDGFKAGVWTEDDFLDGTRGTSKDGRELWAALLDDCAKEAKKEVTKSDGVRLAQWIDAIFAKAPPKDVTPSYVPSSAEKKDLEAQGMTTGKELRRLELALFLGRAPNDDGIEGGVYRGVPNGMAESKLAFKQNHETIERVVARCRTDGSLAQLDRFITNLSADMSASDSATDKLQSARVLMWFSEAKRNLSGSTMAILTYIDEYRATYRGRGLPFEYDTTIGQRAMNLGMTGGLPSGGLSLKSLGGTSSSGSSLSYPTHSMSETGSSAAITAAVDQMKGMTTAMESMQSTVLALAHKVEKLEGWKSDAHITCSGCGEVGHRNRNCPNKDRKAKKEKAEE